MISTPASEEVARTSTPVSGVKKKLTQILLSRNSLVALQALISLLGIKTLHSVYKRRTRILPKIMSYWELIKENQFLLGGLSVSAAAIPTAFIGYVVLPAWRHIVSLFRAHVIVESKDRNYATIRDFVMKMPHTGIIADQELIASTKKKDQTWRQQWKEESGVVAKKADKIVYSPQGQESPIEVQYEGHAITVYIAPFGQPQVTGRDRQLSQQFQLHFYAYGYEGTAVIKRLIQHALDDEVKNVNTNTTKVFVLSGNWWEGLWTKAMEKPKRDKSSVVLDLDLSEKLVTDAKSFLGRGEWYRKRGIPYRRGYLLYGPPGTGKTSFAQVMAAELNANICLLTLTDPGLSDNRLAESMRDAPEGSIILLEDVDAVFVDRRSSTSKAEPGVSFSGLLNAIDGVASQEGRIFIMTTNHLEKLDDALTRPGRCDKIEKLSLASKGQMKNLFIRFYTEELDHEEARDLESIGEKFASMLPAGELSMAKLSGYLLQHDKIEDALSTKNIQSLLHIGQEKQIVQNVRIYDHLHRVGLGQFAPFFEKHHFRWKHDLVRLKVEDTKTWCWELMYDDRTFNRLKRLLDGDSKMDTEEYPMATISTIRDAFLAHFEAKRMLPISNSSREMFLVDMKGENVVAGSTHTLSPIALRRVGSAEYDELLEHAETGSVHADEDELSIPHRLQKLSRELVSCVSSGGKVLLSLWQLRWLLTQFDNPDDLIAAARIMVAPRDHKSYLTQDLDTTTWLKWAGMEKHAHAFEEEGYTLFLTVQREITCKSDLPRSIKGEDAAFLIKLLKNDDADRDVTVGMMRPDRSAVVVMFWTAYAQSCDSVENKMLLEAASQFATLVTHAGSSLVSTIQLETYFKKFPGDFRAALKHYQSHLLEVPLPPKPVKPKPALRPTVWVEKALRDVDGLAEISSCLQANNITTKADLLSEPPFTEEQLSSLGIKKIGTARHLLRLIASIKEEGCHNVPEVGDEVLAGSFGKGVVSAFRPDDDVYEIKLDFGGVMYCGDIDGKVGEFKMEAMKRKEEGSCQAVATV
jgi:DNA polymerase III delta prime subunit